MTRGGVLFPDVGLFDLDPLSRSLSAKAPPMGSPGGRGGRNSTSLFGDNGTRGGKRSKNSPRKNLGNSKHYSGGISTISVAFFCEICYNTIALIRAFCSSRFLIGRGRGEIPGLSLLHFSGRRSGVRSDPPGVPALWYLLGIRSEIGSQVPGVHREESTLSGGCSLFIICSLQL